ncbi:hypothetical protein JT529_001897 [Salmonella enterica subsp. enterica serovar 4,[5],12:i:-]|nr:hypothetical protein [Salmonella enterica subsp. enterica serovar 4,[5],12:i:-]EHC1766993.1 hypothetical protein [Salmonella enterica subsp. enterica serovar 4,[5],12:i:-]
MKVTRTDLHRCYSPISFTVIRNKRVIWKRVGRIRRLIGFKLRVITKSPVTLSGCQIRLE